MQVNAFTPAAPLLPFVHSFEIIEAEAETTRTLFPASGAVLGFRYRGASALVEGGTANSLPDHVFTGPRSTTRRMRTSAGSGIVLVKFRGSGAATFIDAPMHEFLGGTFALDSLLPHAAVDRVSSQLVSAPDHHARIQAVEAFLLARCNENARDRAVEAAVRWIHAAHGSISVQMIADRAGVGIDTLEKRFRRVVGMAPKRLASLVRLRHAADLARSARNLTELALDAGYYDQSHFIREFRAATGTTPRRFFGAAEHCRG